MVEPLDEPVRDGLGSRTADDGRDQAVLVVRRRHRGADERVIDVLVGEVAVLARVPTRMDGVGIGLERRGRPCDLGRR